MKRITILILALFGLFLTSCDENNGSQFETLIQANPVFATKDEVRASISVEFPKQVNEAGKIYVYGNYVFVNDRGEGIHVIDNSNAVSPEKIAYIKIPGNYDIEVRNDVLYADSYGDLVLFDISNIETISLIDITEDVFNNFSFSQQNHTEEFDFIDFGDDFDSEQNYIVDWTYEEVVIEIFAGDESTIDLQDTASGNTVGQGGSFARFKIVDTYLYVVDLSALYTFDISTQGTATPLGQQSIGWQIETIFNQDEYLYIGSANGMFIYDITNRTTPQYASEIQHLTGCDPVVVDGDYAYLTLRGGNFCGQPESILEVIDVSDRNNPFTVNEYPVQEPYGLGVKGDYLYVSDGRYGFNIYDKSDPTNLVLINTFLDINVFDVIPQDDRLLAIAENVLYQYMYEGPNLNLISQFEID